MYVTALGNIWHNNYFFLYLLASSLAFTLTVHLPWVICKLLQGRGSAVCRAVSITAPRAVSGTHHKRSRHLLPERCCCCCWVASAVSDSVRPHRRQPARLPRPWDSPGKNTGVGCHCLLQCMRVKREREVAQSCPTLCDPMDCSPPGSSVHGLFQARGLEWVPLPCPLIEWLTGKVFWIVGVQ